MQCSSVGESLPEDSGLKLFQTRSTEATETAAPDSSTAQAAVDDSAQPSNSSAIPASATPAGGSAPGLPPAREELDDDDLVTHQSVKELYAQTDENGRLLAMSPWIRALGEMRAAEEKKIAQVCLFIASFGVLKPLPFGVGVILDRLLFLVLFCDAFASTQYPTA
jgi:hypothetical protein